MLPVGVIRPILALSYEVNQRLPSGPAVICEIELKDVGSLNAVRLPVGVMRTTALFLYLSAPPNQRLPSGPAVITPGSLSCAGNSVMVPVITGVVVLVPVSGFVLLVAGGFVLPPVPQAIRRGIIHPSRPNRTNLRANWEEMFMIILSLITTEPLSRMVSF